MFSLADEFAKKTPTHTQVQYREESRHMSRDTYSSVSSNTVRNFPSVYTKFLNMYKKSLSKLAGGVMVTMSHPSWMSKSNRAAPDGHERELERV